MKEEKLQAISSKSYTFENLIFTPELFYKKSIVIYGTTNTGKSYLTNDIFNCLADKVAFLIAFSKTAYDDKKFPLNGYTEEALIYESLNFEALAKYLKSCKERKELKKECRKIYNLKKGIKVLRDIYNDQNDMNEIKYLNKKLKGIKKYLYEKSKFVDSADSRTDLEEKIQQFYCFLMKRGLIYCNKKKIDLTKYANSTGDNIISIMFSNINTKSIILFNDLGDEIRNAKGKNKGLIIDLFTMGRHYDCIILCLIQDSTLLPPTARQNGMINIFTSSACVMKYIEQEKGTKETKKYFAESTEVIINDDNHRPNEGKKYTKIIYLKEENIIKYIVADKMGEQRKVGNKYLLENIRRKSIKKESAILENLGGYIHTNH